ncbi:MAG: endonuclease/exonuclease/phosphatase family protein [Thermoanaerobaculia bacterium]
MSSRINLVWLLAAAAAGPYAAAPRIVIDGRFDDWVGVEPTPVDGPLGLTALTTLDDPGALYLRLDFAREVLLQGLDEPVRLLLDADDNPVTGRTVSGFAGADVAVVFSPAEARGISVLRWGTGEEAGEELTSYALGLVAAPTYAAARIELRLERGDLPVLGRLFAGSGVRGVLTSVAGAAPSAAFRHAFATAVAPEPRTLRESASVTRASGTELRVLSWNVAGESLLRQAALFRRMLTALAPDLVLLDEVPAGVTASDLLPLFADLIGRDRRGWEILVGDGGGRQHGVVASRHDLKRLPALERVPYPEGFPAWLQTVDRSWIRDDLAGAEEDGVSAFGALLGLPDLRLAVATLDLQCCGRPGDPEERIREIQAEALRGALLAVRGAGPDALIVAGDLNLVGGRGPLDLLRLGTGPQGGDLEVVDALQLDGLSAATWGFSGEFPPSRLDYFLLSAETLEVLRAFAFDSRDLAPRERDALGLRRRDSHAASGHLPLVVDVRRRRR